jgi:DDE superfamily endonuclease
VEEGLDAVLSRKPRATPAVAKIFDGAAEARVIALACSQPPVGHARWSLRLLESKVVELGIIRIGRAAVDYAHALKDLADTHFPVAAKIVLVQDNLNTHCPASLYEAFPAAEARHIVERFEWHYTPKHGSWLDLAESELGMLAAQCLDRRIPDKQTIINEVEAWTKTRNTAKQEPIGASQQPTPASSSKPYTPQIERIASLAS